LILLAPALVLAEEIASLEMAPDRLIEAKFASPRSNSDAIVERRHTVSLERLERTPPPDAIAEFQESWVAFRDGNLEKAIKKVQAAIREYPEFIEAHNNLAYFYWQQGDRENGLKEFEKTVELDPTWGAALTNLALAYYSTGDPASALDVIRRAVEIQPQSARAHYTAGLILLLSDEKSNEALDHFETAIRDFPQARLMAAYVMLRMNRHEQAEQTLTQYLQSAPLF
jgi:tetratricopeptide (TPR) repeat protein